MKGNVRILTEKFNADLRVKAKAGEKKIIIIPVVSLRCELSSDCANKIIIDAVNFDFQHLKNFAFLN
jgi:hypothetical protein